MAAYWCFSTAQAGYLGLYHANTVTGTCSLTAGKTLWLSFVSEHQRPRMPSADCGIVIQSDRSEGWLCTRHRARHTGQKPSLIPTESSRVYVSCNYGKNLRKVTETELDRENTPKERFSARIKGGAVKSSENKRGGKDLVTEVTKGKCGITKSSLALKQLT